MGMVCSCERVNKENKENEKLGPQGGAHSKQLRKPRLTSLPSLSLNLLFIWQNLLYKACSGLIILNPPPAILVSRTEL